MKTVFSSSRYLPKISKVNKLKIENRKPSITIRLLMISWTNRTYATSNWFNLDRWHVHYTLYSF